MRAQNAIDRGVPFPKPWKTAIKFAAEVAKMRQAAISHAVKVAGNSVVDCELLGIPRHADVLDELCGKESGTVVPLVSSTGLVKISFLPRTLMRMSGCAIQEP